MVDYECLIGYRFNHTGELNESMTCQINEDGMQLIAFWNASNIACVRMNSILNFLDFFY